MFYRRATYPVRAWRIRAVFALFGVLVVGAGLTGCAGGPTKLSSSTTENVHSAGISAHERSSALSAAEIAAKQVGIPYRYGGADTKGFDCSGLVYYSYSNAGIQVARTTSGLWKSLQPVSRDQLRSGDILFFDIEGKMSHVGLYLGRGRFVHAPSTGKNVVITALDSDFYRRALIRGGRVERGR